MTNNVKIKDENKVQSKEQLWTLNFILPIIIITAIAAAYMAVNANFALYIKSIGGSATLTGSIALAWSIVSMFARPIAGTLSSKYGTKRMTLIGLVGFGLIFILLGNIAILSLFIGLRVVQAAFHSTAYTAANSAAGEVAPKSRMGEASAFYIGIPQSLSLAIGPALGLWLISLGGGENFTAMFTGGAAVIGVATLLTLLIKSQKKEPSKSTLSEKEEVKKALDENGNEYIGIWKIIERKAIAPSFVMALATIGGTSVQYFLTLFVATFSLPGAAIFFTFTAVSELATRFYVGFIQDKWGTNIVLIPGLLLTGLSMAMIGMGITNWALIGLIYGFGQGGIRAPLNGFMLKRVSKERISVATGTYQMANAVGLGLVSFVCGILIDNVGFTGMWYFCATMMVICAIISVFLFSKKRQESL